MKNDLTQARKLIQECLETQNPYLEIGNCDITDLDDLPELFECTHLETLIISNRWWSEEKREWIKSENSGKPNELSKIPKGINQLVNLKTLVLAGDSSVNPGHISTIDNLSGLVRLTRLDLNFNKIHEIKNLDNLTELRTLYCTVNKILRIKSLDKLRQLKELHLDGNRITEIENLSALVKLKHLNLSRNQINEIKNLDGLAHLIELNLSRNQITEIKNLDKLIQLRNLYLDENQITEIKNLDCLVQLAQIDLGKNQINEIKNLGCLTQLEVLELRHNQNIEIKNLGNLINLQRLGLALNQVKVIKNLEALTQLSHLDLAGNQITEIKNLNKLVRLKDLSLDGNKITEIRALGDLTQLVRLDLTLNKIFEIKNSKDLECLSKLHLSGNRITDIKNLNSLIQLRELSLNGNQITEIKNLDKLTQLTGLDLSDNKITEIKNLGKLIGLNHLSLSGNQITEVPLNILERCNAHLLLNKNPIHTPPVEIVKQGRQAMLDWYAANKKKLSEIKVILIGDPGAGKTSLLRMLKTGDFNPKEPQTDGINIEDIVFEKLETFLEYENLHGITGHFWDFGGQEIMNATHQFFLTNRSVYVLLLDARKDTHVSSQVRQWVKRIKATGGNSPIIVVANQIDVNPGFGFENERELQEEFPEIKAFIKASCADGTQIEIIKQKLSELIPQAELFDTEIDERWIQIKDKLQEEIDNQQDKYLDEKRFNEICEEFELFESRQRQNAIQFLHDLGILLHFKEIEEHKYFVLDPYWITYGVYQILTSDKAGKLNGLVPMTELDYIINREEDKKESYRNESQEKINYLSNDRRFLVDVLHQFKLSFYQPDRKKFIIPDLLDTVEPVSVTDPIRKAHGSIHFVYEYEYLLKSIMPRIMVEQHELIKERWRTGCVLQKGNCRAVITSYQQRITISVAGDHPEKREFMSILRHHLDTINSKLTEPPKMLIPLPKAKGFASYKTLLMLQKKGRREYEIFEPDYEEFKISTLLEGIDDVDKLDQLRELIEKNHSEAKKDRKLMLGNQMVIENKADKIKEDTQAIKIQLEEYYQYLITQPGNEELKNHLLPELTKITDKQTSEIADSLITMLQHHFEHSEEMLNEKYQEAYEILTKTEDTQLKIKLGIPLGNLIGFNIEGEFDIKNWSKRMYEKYSWPLFKVMGGFK